MRRIIFTKSFETAGAPDFLCQYPNIHSCGPVKLQSDAIPKLTTWPSLGTPPQHLLRLSDVLFVLVFSTRGLQWWSPVTGCIRRETPKGREIPHLKVQTYSLDPCLEFKTARCLETVNEQPRTPVLREEGGDQNVIADLYLLRALLSCRYILWLCNLSRICVPSSKKCGETDRKQEGGWLWKRLTRLSLRLTKTNRTNI